jgi:hypothetical protein
MLSPAMSETPDPSLPRRQCEGLVTLTALYYIEEHELLDAAQLEDAKNSLQAMFLRTSGAEAMLRRLIDILKVRRNLQNSFSAISGTIMAVRRSVEVMGERVENLRRLIARAPLSAEANAEFIGAFQSFSLKFLRKIEDFESALQKYVTAREHQARKQTVFKIAEEGRERLRKRLTGSDLGQATGKVEQRIKGEVATSLNYTEAEAAMIASRKLARAAEAGVQALLRQIHTMAQATLEPAKRDVAIILHPSEDLRTRFAGAQLRHSVVMNRIKGPIGELMDLCQRAPSMFLTDYDRLRQALKRLDGNNSTSYFEAKAEDRNIDAKREQLRKIEVLIEFLERAAQLIATDDKALDNIAKFSRALSEVLCEPYASWKLASQELLTAKVRAEADLALRQPT